MFTIYGGKTEFNQWDLDQKVVNPNMCDCEQVIFTMSNGRVGISSAYEYEGQMVADVPNHLLKYDGNMMVDLGQNQDQRIEERTFFNVTECEQPEGYVCTANRNLEKKYLETVAQELTEAEKAQVRKNIGAGEGSGGGSVQQDWNEWDENNPACIKNKPFGYKAVTIVEETVTASDGMAFLNATGNFIVGGTYKVYFDGVEYTCVGVDISMLSSGAVAIGNLGLAGLTDTGEPFAIATAYGGIMYTAEDGEHTVKVVGPSYVKLPLSEIEEKEIPYFNLGDFGLTSDVIPVDGTSVTVECDTTVLLQALLNGLVKFRVALKTITFDDITAMSWYQFWAYGSGTGDHQSVVANVTTQHRIKMLVLPGSIKVYVVAD